MSEKTMKRSNVRSQNRKKSVVNSLVALILSLALSAVMLAVSGHSPIETYAAIFGASLGTLKGIGLTLSQATPLLFTGMSFAIAYKVRMINTGAEGQLYSGAMAAALVGAYIKGLPPVLHLILCLLAAALAGGFTAGIVAFLKIKFKANEIIMTLMLNNVIILLTSYLANGPLKPAGSGVGQTEKIQASAKLLRLIPQTQVTVALIIAVALAIILQFMLDRTAFGYEIQVTGYNLQAARTAGIHVSSVYLKTFSIAGAIAGLGGAALILGVNYRFIEGFSANYGFSGISIAALAAYSPLGVILSALLIGILKAGTITLNRTTDVPIEFVSVIQVLVIVFVAAPELIQIILSLPKKLFGKNKMKLSPVTKEDN